MSAKQYGSDPATIGVQVVPANTAMATVPRALYVNTSGNLSIRDTANNLVVYSVVAQQILPFRPYIITTDTTANVVAWY